MDYEEAKEKVTQSREEITRTLDATVKTLEDARDEIQKDKNECSEEELKAKVINTINNLVKNLNTEAAIHKIQKANQSYYKHITNFGKLIGKYMNDSIEDASLHTNFPKDTLNKVILEHLYKNDLLDSVTQFCTETGITAPTENKKKYEELNEIRKELKVKKLDKAGEWVKGHVKDKPEKIKEAQFIVHKLQVLF